MHALAVTTFQRETNMLPSLRGLRVFCMAARFESFKAAAEQLFITASAVSHQIKALERELGVSLFDRDGRQLTLTDEGARLHGRLDPLLLEIENVIASTTYRPQPHAIRVTAPPFFASELLIPGFPEIFSDDVSAELSVETAASPNGKHPDQADVAVILSDTAPADTASRTLFSLELIPAAAPALAARLKDAPIAAWTDETLIVHRGRPNAWRRWYQQSGITLRQPDKLMLLDTMFSVARAAERGLGIALVPAVLTRQWLRSNALVRLSADGLFTKDHYFLSWRPALEERMDVNRIAERLKDYIDGT